jgi:hypothetical protein
MMCLLFSALLHFCAARTAFAALHALLLWYCVYSFHCVHCFTPCAPAPFSVVLWGYGTSRKGSGKEQAEEIAHKFKKKSRWIHTENGYYGLVNARKLLLVR